MKLSVRVTGEKNNTLRVVNRRGSQYPANYIASVDPVIPSNGVSCN